MAPTINSEVGVGFRHGLLKPLFLFSCDCLRAPSSMCGHPQNLLLVVVNKDKSGFALSRAQLLPEQALPQVCPPEWCRVALRTRY